MHYRRADAAEGTYFFTLNLAERRSDILAQHIDDLRTVLKMVKETRPFAILAMVVLPEHLHALWCLPPGDADSVELATHQGGLLTTAGSGDIGNIKSATKPTLRGTSITFISRSCASCTRDTRASMHSVIPSNMAGSPAP